MARCEQSLSRHHRVFLRWLSLGSSLLLALNLGACATLAVSVAGAGAGVGFSHQVNGVVSRTFSEPLPRVHKAVQSAARHMEFQLALSEHADKAETLKGKMADLDVSVELESLSDTVTRVSVRARKNFFVLDGATAQEVVTQIDRALLATAAPASLPRSDAAPNPGASSTRTNARSKTKNSAPI